MVERDTEIFANQIECASFKDTQILSFKLNSMSIDRLTLWFLIHGTHLYTVGGSQN